jgi:hypothetical protein
MGLQKRSTILHSNDMHGDFLAEMRGEEGHLIGGRMSPRWATTSSTTDCPTSCS